MSAVYKKTNIISNEIRNMEAEIKILIKETLEEEAKCLLINKKLY